MQNSNDLPMEWIERIFMRLHGRFGNQFHDKFKTGQVSNGEDVGIINAKLTWASVLAGISIERIKLGLLAAYDYPPSCDDFKKNCITSRIDQPIYVALPAPLKHEQNRAYADNVVEFINRDKKDKTDYKDWARKIVANPSAYPDISLSKAREALATADV